MFGGDPTLRGAGERFEYTEEMIKEIIRCKEDILYWAEKYFYIMSIDKGKIKIPLWDFQKKLLKVILNPPDNKRHVIVLSARQMSKTTVSTIFLLHTAIFSKDETIGILANREATAIEILSRLQFAYTNLPIWMQRGVVEWNKKSMKLENDVKIKAQATSSNSLRGESPSTILVDEMAFIPDYIWEGFYSSVYPAISSGKRAKIIMVSTPNGLNHFYDFYKKATLGENDYYPVKINWNQHPERNEKWKEMMIRDCGKQRFEVEFNNKFLGSTSTLCDPNALENLFPKEPIDISKWSGAFQIFEYPQDGCQYILGVDPGKGTGGDYSVVQVLKLKSQHEIEQVAIYRSNYIKIESFANIIIGISDYYNSCEAMVESNDVGELLCKDLWEKKNFDRLLNCDKKGLGIRATRKTKLDGNLLLKEYIDNKWLEIYDKRTIYELSRYVEVSPDVYHAEGQHENDDCVSGLLWALYYLKTDFYDSGYNKKDGSDSDFMNFAILDGNVVGNVFDKDEFSGSNPLYNSGHNNSNMYGGNQNNDGFNLY